jgi:hypothetical protein
MYATSINIKKKLVDETSSAISYRSSLGKTDFGSSFSSLKTKLASISRVF